MRGLQIAARQAAACLRWRTRHHWPTKREDVRPMAEARNDISWQQGFVLRAESAVSLGLIDSAAGNDRVVLLVSHDCDLVESSEIEPNCEIIVGRKIEKGDGTFAGAKNPRCLHLPFSAGEMRMTAEFLAKDKRQIEKSSIL